ncbi:response regulator [Legionella antarctica]|uniref:Response regulator n=2 Tax=Legionella antarctica TaxID=2708020 RepID=A0A6F8T0U2_9GAMM|nr:response regulator [Legionella antarctica]
MRVLIVEDNAFNAFCLRRLLESVVTSVSVSIVTNSQAALVHINASLPDMVVVDGDLGAIDEQHCNGPQLVNLVLQKNPYLPIIAWSDSESMRDAFKVVFNRFNKPLNEYNTWTKAINIERICKSWAYYFGEFMAGQNPAFAYHQSTAGYY